MGGDFVRAALLAPPGPGQDKDYEQGTVYDNVIDEFAALRTQIARIGTNVNQIAHRLNSGDHPHLVDAAVLERADRVMAPPGTR